MIHTIRTKLRNQQKEASRDVKVYELGYKPLVVSSIILRFLIFVLEYQAKITKSLHSDRNS